MVDAMGNGGQKTAEKPVEEVKPPEKKPGRIVSTYQKVKGWVVRPGESMFGMSHESKPLCDLLNRGLAAKAKNNPKAVSDIMDEVYRYMTTTKGLSRTEGEAATEVLKKLYLILPEDAKKSSVASSVKFVRNAYGMVSGMEVVFKVAEKTLKEEEVLGIARILSQRIGPDPAKLGTAFGVKLTPTNSSLLLMELFAKNQNLAITVVDSYDAALRNMLGLLNTVHVNGDKLGGMLLNKFYTKVQSGGYTSAESALLSVFQEDETKKILKDTMDKGIGAREAKLVKAVQDEGEKKLAAATSAMQKKVIQQRTDSRIIGIRKAAEKTKKQAAEFIDALAGTKSFDEVKSISKPVPTEARRIIELVRDLSASTSLKEQVEARRLLESVAKPVIAAKEAEARSIGAGGRAVGGRFERAGLRVQARVGRMFGPFADDIRLFRNVPEARARAAWSLTKRAAFPLAVGAGAAYGIYWYFWGRESKEREKAREELSIKWGVEISKGTYDLMKSSPFSDNFFQKWLDYGHISSLGRLVPQNEADIRALVSRKDLFVNPARLSDLAVAVSRHVDNLKKQGKSDADIAKSLDGRVRGDWRAAGFFLTPGELYVEQFSKQLNLSREIANYLKQDSNFLVLLWAAIRDGSLPRASTAGFARAVFADKAQLRKLKDIVESRAKIPVFDRPSVRDSLETAGIRYPSFLLENPIRQGSLMDLYDQYATYDAKSHAASFKSMLERYVKDDKARERLDAFKLGRDETVYGNISSLVEAVVDDRKYGPGRMSVADYARRESIIASNVFERLGVSDRNAVKFVYNPEYSQKEGSGLVKWFINNAKFIRLGKDEKSSKAHDIIQAFRNNESAFRGKDFATIEKRAQDLVAKEKFEDKGWYMKTDMPFQGRSVRDTVPRPELEPPKRLIPATEIETAKALWDSPGASSMKAAALALAENKAFRQDLVKDPLSRTRIVNQLVTLRATLKPKSKEARIFPALIAVLGKGRVGALSKPASALLTKAISADLEQNAPMIVYRFLMENGTEKKEGRLAPSAKFEGKYGMKLTLFNDKIKTIGITDFVKSASIDKELQDYVRVAYRKPAEAPKTK